MSRDAVPCVLVLACLLEAVGAAQSPPRADIAAYRRLVMQYIEGDAAGAVAEVAILPAGGTKAIVDTHDVPWTLQLMHAAAMLETDAAFSSREVSGTSSARVLTDLPSRLSNAQLWLERANKALPSGQRDVFWRQWSVVVGRRLLGMSIFGVADEMLKTACDRFADDAGVHLAYGIARESASFAMGADAAQEVSMGRTPSNGPRLDALSDARTALERAVKLDPGSAEARVRLAHVYLVLRDDRHAAPLLEQTLALDVLPVYRYLASIMLGDVQSRAGQLEPAVTLYLDARRLMPTGQSAYIAHAHALSAAGQADAAAGVIREMLTRARHDDDPWTMYPMGFDVAGRQLDPLRAQARKQ